MAEASSSDAAQSDVAKVLLTDYAWADLELEERMLGEAGHGLIVAASADEATLVESARDASVILACWASVTAAVIDAAPNCRLVGRLGIGLDNIALEHCTQRGIPVTNVPAYCVDEVAEHALALLFALARRVAFFHHRAKGGEYDLGAGGPIRRIRGRTLGIAGFGKIGQALAQRALALGLETIAWNRAPIETDLPVVQVEFEELLARSDFVSIHLPLTEETRRLFDGAALARMRPTACLINTARGPIIDPEALGAALEAGRLAGAALDVHDREPPDLSDPLYRDERVIVTPHAAFASVESLETLRETALRQAIDMLAGRRPEHVVNPEVYSSGS